MDWIANARLVMADRLPKNAVGAEIGVFRGDYTQVLLDRTQPSRLWLIDPWRIVQASGYREALYSAATTTQADMDLMHASVVARFSAEIAGGRVVVERACSDTALARLPDGALDWVYIDGDHTHAGTMCDLVLSARKVPVGGFIVGDDYMLGGWWKGGVLTALHQFLHAQAGAWIIELVLGSQYMLRRTA